MKTNKKTEKLETGASRRKSSGSSICFAVREIGSEGQQILISVMRNMSRKNHHGTRKYSGANSGYVLLRREFLAGGLLSGKSGRFYGAPGTSSAKLNRLRSLGVVPFAAMVRSISMGSRACAA
ncbi:MAG: hypothetical protein KAS17_02345 [Victivallaceae bacterium]|nr:hypothetical protein [Victivallaceae bacterium]